LTEAFHCSVQFSLDAGYIHRKSYKKYPNYFQKAISELPCASVSKRVLMQNSSQGNGFDLNEYEYVDRTD